MDAAKQRAHAETFRRLHQGPEILVLCNTSDVGTSRIVVEAGFLAVATSSAGIAWLLGYPDGEKIGRDEMLEMVRIADSKQRLGEYPHQLSGGMRQRVMIAIALCCNPQVLIADEPTTALDVTIQAQILDLMLELKDKLGTAIILITHDLGVVAETCERVIVMYAGRAAEEAPSASLFARPLHPYTRGLLRALPRAETEAERAGGRQRLIEIPGMVPALTRPIAGCAFAPRCGYVAERCRTTRPAPMAAEPEHRVACWETGRVAAEAPA